MSAIQANNENKTVFNIIMENGLPYKPFIIAETSVFTQKGNPEAAIVHLNITTDELDGVLDSFECKRTTIDDSQVYVDVGDYYIVGEHNSNLVTNSARDRTIAVKFYRNGNFLFWIGFND